MSIHTTDIDVTGVIAIDDVTRENEFGERVRATYYVGNQGGVLITGLMVNEARPGKPDLWFPVDLPRFITRHIEKMLEDGIREERDLRPEDDPKWKSTSREVA